MRMRRRTGDYGGDQSDDLVRGAAGGPRGLQDVLREGEGGDGVAGGDDHEQRHPEVEEGRQGPERLADVRVVSPRPGDHRTCKPNVPSTRAKLSILLEKFQTARRTKAVLILTSL